MHLDILYSDMA